MELADLIKLRDAILGAKLLELLKTPVGVDKIVEMMADCQAESILAGYNLGKNDSSFRKT